MIANKLIYFYAFIQICILIHRRTFVLTITSHNVSILWNWDGNKALAVLCSRCENEISIRFNCKEMHSQEDTRPEPMRQSCDKQIISFYLLCVVLEKNNQWNWHIFRFSLSFASKTCESLRFSAVFAYKSQFYCIKLFA